MVGRSGAVDHETAPSNRTSNPRPAPRRLAVSTSGLAAAIVRASSSSTRSMVEFTVGLTTNQKKPPTRSNRLAAIVTMTATSLPNTDVDRRSITTASREAIANAPDRTDECRMFGVVAELLAHTADED